MAGQGGGNFWTCGAGLGQGCAAGDQGESLELSRIDGGRCILPFNYFSRFCSDGLRALLIAEGRGSTRPRPS